MRHPITVNFITGNPGKVVSMQRHLDSFDIAVKQTPLDIIEPQADTVEEIARSKARQAYAKLKTPLVVDDSAFCITELNGFPGPYIKYTLQTIGAEGILQIAQHLKSRACTFAAALVYIDEDGKEHLFTDTSPNQGRLATELAPHTNDAAWSELWRIYIADGTNKPLSILEPTEYEHVQAEWQEQSRFRAFGEWLRYTY